MEEVKVEATCKAEEECQAELAREHVKAERQVRAEAVQEVHIEWQRQEFKAQKAQEQQWRSQARVEAITATQGSGAMMTVPAVAADRRCTPCVRCQDHLRNPAGCVAQAKLKATVCVFFRWLVQGTSSEATQ